MKSSFSGATGCVDVTRAPSGNVVVRHSRPAAHGCCPTQLMYTPVEFQAFLLGVKAGEFDHLVEQVNP